MPSQTELANAIRVLAMDAVQAANSGHPGAPMGMADIAEVLWNRLLRHNPTNPRLAQSRPIRALEWSWVDADLCACCI